MNNNNQVFVKLKGKVSFKKGDTIFIKDLIEICADKDIKEKLENMAYLVDIKNQSSTLISAISVISFIKRSLPNTNLIIIGDNDILVNIEENGDNKDKYKVVRLILVCFLLFIGSVTAIINFHSDVDMRNTHKIIYKVITGIENDRPLLLQIPYSLGIGAGMSVFFNHVFKKRINNEPTPLEMEIYTYQKNVDEYIKNNNTK